MANEPQTENIKKLPMFPWGVFGTKQQLAYTNIDLERFTSANTHGCCNTIGCAASVQTRIGILGALVIESVHVGCLRQGVVKQSTE